ncbi:hypothetical protein MYAM1_001124 [Malassezia yamatoensis]|uniref:Eisosome component PIL1-domain-containing protein n=1 Tax=Malassezia yamatoensis TaxID=253288 RepID=A0AAJ6CFK8_9BASI|nr:hypothetical protein MYAM1_001124 [Malassezia yamatoensis]
MSIFRKAQTAVAHNSTFSTFGNSDLKDLQNLINAEKLFTTTNAKAASEIQKSADSLRSWSGGSGDDLEDVLPKVALLYEHFGRAQLRFNHFVSTMRLHLKSIRSREEAFAELKGRKRTLASKIEGVERKLAKMGPENKELAKVTSSLREMRSDMEVLRNEVEHEEAGLGDFKRRTIVEALNLKSGGMMELGEKCIVIAETCRLLGDELPLAATLPGKGRSPYRSKCRDSHTDEARTDRLLQEAIRQLDAIHFQPRDDIQSEALSRDYSSPTVAKPNDSVLSGTEAQGATATSGLGSTGSRSGGGMRTAALAADQSLSMDDTSRGSQGWAAPGLVGTQSASSQAPDLNTGLPTVMESEDPIEPSDAYDVGQRDDPNELATYQEDTHGQPYPEGMATMPRDSFPTTDPRMRQASFPHESNAIQEPAQAGHAYPANYEDAPGEYGAYGSEPPHAHFADTQLPTETGYEEYDMGYGYATDAIPALPPAPSSTRMPPSGSQYASHTPNSRDSPGEEHGESRAYFEGVGSTKALQAAAARNNHFPAIDHMDLNYTPGMFATDENSGRSLSPSALRHFGHTSPSRAASPRFNDTASYRNLASVSRPISPDSAYAQRMQPSYPSKPSFASNAPMQQPTYSAGASPLSPQFPEQPQSSGYGAMAPAAHSSSSQAPPPISAPNPLRYARNASSETHTSSPMPVAAPSFSTGALYAPQAATSAADSESHRQAPPGYEPVSQSDPTPISAPTSEPAAAAPSHHADSSSNFENRAAAAPAMQVGAYLPYVSDSNIAT